MTLGADDLIVERASRDFEEGLAHARHRIRETHGRIAAVTLDALVMTAVGALHLRARMRDDVRHLVGLAHRVAEGEDARKLAEEHLDHVLRLKRQMHLIANEDDPEFQHVKALALDLFAKRLPDLARMATVPEPKDYGDLVRRAFPDRAHVDALVDENGATVGRIVDHLEKHPHVLHMPRALAAKVATTAREMIAWKIAEVRRGVDEIYRAEG